MTSSVKVKLIPPKGGWGSRIYYLTPQANSVAAVPVTAQESVPIKVENSGEATASQTVKVEKLQHGHGHMNGELTKKELKAKAEKSLAARRALSQWNKMNTTIRRLVIETQFHGSGGLSKCIGTSQEQAALNQGTREAISRNEKVSCFFETFSLEDGSGRVTIDHSKAAEHVRVVINNRKRGPSGTSAKNSSKEKAAEAKETEEQDDGDEMSGTISNSDQSLETAIEVPSSATNAGILDVEPAQPQSQENALKRRNKRGREVLSDSESEDDDMESTRSAYEMERAERVRDNRQFLFDHGVRTKLLDDDDAVVICRKWFRAIGGKLKISDVVKAIESLSLAPVTKGSTFRRALVHFGNELVKNDLVILKKQAGLTKDDIIIE